MMKNKERKEFLKYIEVNNSKSKKPEIYEEPETIYQERPEYRDRARKIDRQKDRRLRERNKRLAALGLTGTLTVGAIVGCNMNPNGLNQEKTSYKNEPAVEQEDKNYIEVEESKTIREEVNGFENKEDAYRFLKNMYIELYEEKNGESEYTTENITLEDVRYQDYVFVNSMTGEHITHGDTPDVTKQKLINDNIPFEIEENVKVYSIENNEGKIIDSVSVDNKGISHKVVRGDQYEEAYNSILVDMGEVFVNGLNYANVLENGNEYDKEVGKNKFIESLEKQKQAKENQKMAESKQQEMVAQIEEDDFEIE